MDMISLGGLRTAFLTGGLRTVGVTAAGGLFFVTVQPRSGAWMVLATTRENKEENRGAGSGTQVRRFRSARNGLPKDCGGCFGLGTGTGGGRGAAAALAWMLREAVVTGRDIES